MTSQPFKSTIDVVIPIYNAYDYLVPCIESVLANTPDEIRIICINDHSTDVRIHPYLEKIRLSQKERLIVHHNKKNEGFVSSVNRGMSQNDENDIVLLNTDTVVTKDWIKNLHKCAYSNPKIATVTPLSNNGNSICSVPTFGSVNEVPEGYTVDTFGELITKRSQLAYIEIPTAVGFCMYIKRSVVNQIGLFDSKTYGKGYGEETDFSRRAIKDGYINVMDDATYIFHHGGASFNTLSLKTAGRQEKSLKILTMKYPEFLDEWDSFMTTNPAKSIHRLIYFWMKHDHSEVPEIVNSVKLLLYTFWWKLKDLKS